MTANAIGNVSKQVRDFHDFHTITVRNPADGKVVGCVAVEGAEAVARKASELRLFQPEWEQIGPGGRKRWLLTLRDWVLDNAADITDMVMAETGKSRADAALE